jgi:hypothetical protein
VALARGLVAQGRAPGGGVGEPVLDWVRG